MAAAFLVSGALAGCAGEPVAAKSPREVVTQRFASFNRHDLDSIVALYAADALMTSPGFCSNRSGPDGARRTYGDLFRNYPAIQDQVTGMVVEGNRVAVQFTAHVGKYTVPLANFLTVDNGLITRDETYFDTRGQPCN